MKKKIKVLMCGNHPSNKGGMTTVINQILEHDWSQRDIQIKFIPTYYPGKKYKTIVCFALAYIRIFFTLLFAKPDLLYTHMSVRGSFSRTKALHNLCRLMKIPDVIHLHGSEFKDWYSNETKTKQTQITKLISECKSFIVLGKKWEIFVSGIAPDANIIQIHNCIRIPKEIAAQKKDIHFIYLGVLIPRKGLFDLLKAVNQLNDNHEIDNCTFNIGGSGPDEVALKEYVHDNDLNEKVHFLGWIVGDAKEKVLKESSVLILPSYNEGLPISVLEAMSYGLPVISTNVGDIADAVHDDINGFLFDPGDINTLKDAIRKINSLEIRQDFSDNSRRIAEQEFDISLFYSKLESVWKSAINR